MEQRPLRLGDHVDDYCPRERRITNHTIVAIVDDAIKQTRCTTCDSEHVFKDGKTPGRRRKKDSTSALYQEVLANATGGQLVPPDPESGGSTNGAAEPRVSEPRVDVEPAVAAAEAAPNGMNGAAPKEPEQDIPDEKRDEGFSAHRTLIRATLPRTENDQPPPRPIPEFTMHQRGGRGGQGFRQGFWSDRGGRNGNSNGNGNGNSFRGPGGRPPGQGQGRRRHGKRRPR